LVSLSRRAEKMFRFLGLRDDVLLSRDLLRDEWSRVAGCCREEGRSP
jgi:hypothetical protein